MLHGKGVTVGHWALLFYIKEKERLYERLSFSAGVDDCRGFECPYSPGIAHVNRDIDPLCQ